MDLSKMKVVITDCMHLPITIEENTFRPYGIIPELHQCVSEEEVIEACNGADAVITNFAPLTEKVIKTFHKVKSICRYGIGLDNIDIAAATAMGIHVSGISDYGSNEVADHAFALMMSLGRKIVLGDRNIRERNWEVRDLSPVITFDDSVVGVVGMGRIGSVFAQRCAAIGCKVLAYDPFVRKDHIESMGFSYTDNLEDIWKKSDIISLHLPLNQQTLYLVDEKQFAMMKKNAIIINVSRGKLIREKALYDALNNEVIAGAGIDVFEHEFAPKGHPGFEKEKDLPDSILLDLPREKIVVTPHAAWYSDQSYERLKKYVCLEALRVLKGEKPKYAKNLSE